MKINIIIIILIGLLSAGYAAPPGAPEAPPADALQVPGGRLPDEVCPPGYQIDLVIAPRSEHFSGRTRIGERFCTPGHAASLQAFLAPRAEAFPGGGRRLAKSVEAVELCAAGAAIYRAQLCLPTWKTNP